MLFIKKNLNCTSREVSIHESTLILSTFPIEEKILQLSENNKICDKIEKNLLNFLKKMRLIPPSHMRRDVSCVFTWMM